MTIHFGADSTSLASGNISSGEASLDAWAVWDSKGTYSTKASAGVSSVQDQSQAQSRVNFSSNFTDANYVCSVCHDSDYYGDGGDARLPGAHMEDIQNSRCDIHTFVLSQHTNAQHHHEYDHMTAAFWR